MQKEDLNHKRVKDLRHARRLQWLNFHVHNKCNRFCEGI
jgi:hypothetical protein